MNNPKMDWSPIHLSLANQSKVLVTGRLSQVPVEGEGLRTYIDFKFIDIVDDTNPYPALLGIDWAIENQNIINFKKMILSSEDSETSKDSEIRVVVPIDFLKGHKYVESVHNEGKDNYLD